MQFIASISLFTKEDVNYLGGSISNLISFANKIETDCGGEVYIPNFCFINNDQIRL